MPRGGRRRAPSPPQRASKCTIETIIIYIYIFLIDIAACAFTNGRPVRVAVAQRAAAESVLRGSTAAQGRDPDVQRSAIRSLPSPRLAPLGRAFLRSAHGLLRAERRQRSQPGSHWPLSKARETGPTPTEGPLQNPSWICSFVEEPCFDYICFLSSLACIGATCVGHTPWKKALRRHRRRSALPNARTPEYGTCSGGFGLPADSRGAAEPALAVEAARAMARRPLAPAVLGRTVVAAVQIETNGTNKCKRR